jgi:DNA integrity scanning protein DisA with diadenylate cyclase activity
MFGIKDIIDILLVAFILFAIYRILRRSGASNLFWGILAFILTWLIVSYVFQLELTSALFERFISVGAIALIVIFQEEIRGFFYRIGARFNVEHFKDRWSKAKHQQTLHKQADAILSACAHMSASKTGALIVITHQQEL